MSWKARRNSNGSAHSMSESRAHIRLQVLPNGVPMTLATLARNVDVPVLLVVPRPDEARRLYEQVSLWSADERSVLHFPESETLPFERLVTDTDTEQQRIGVLSRLLAHDSPDDDTHPGPNVIVASASAISQKTISREGFEKSLHRLVPGQTLDLRELLDQWRRMGYAFEPTVDLPGMAGRRGGILDVYPVGAEFPARIDLWGDEIDSIRLFDPATQRSTELVEAIDILPAQETLPGLTHPDHVDYLMRSIDTHNCNAETRERIGEEIHRLLDGDEVEDANFYAGFFNHGSLLDYLPNDAIVVRYRPTRHRRGGMGDRGTRARAARGQAVARRASAQLPLVPRPLARDRADARRVSPPHRRYTHGAPRTSSTATPSSSRSAQAPNTAATSRPSSSSPRTPPRRATDSSQ